MTVTMRKNSRFMRSKSTDGVLTFANKCDIILNEKSSLGELYPKCEYIRQLNSEYVPLGYVSFHVLALTAVDHARVVFGSVATVFIHGRKF